MKINKAIADKIKEVTGTDPEIIKNRLMASGNEVYIRIYSKFHNNSESTEQYMDMLKYSTELFQDELDLETAEYLLKSNDTIKISDLIKNFIEIDMKHRYYKEGEWDLLKIIDVIDNTISVEEEKSGTPYSSLFSGETVEIKGEYTE